MNDEIYLELYKICSQYGISIKKVDDPQEAGWIDCNGKLHKQLFSDAEISSEYKRIFQINK